MNNQPYAAGYDNKWENRAAANKIAMQSGRKEAEARERSKQILDYYSNKNERKQR